MSDRPSDDGGSARSDAASRLAALLADVVDDPAPPTPSPHEPDPDATRPIPGLPAALAPASVAGESEADAAAEARERAREEGVLAEARAFRAGAAAEPPVVLQKPPGRPWSRSAAPSAPVVAPPVEDLAPSVPVVAPSAEDVAPPVEGVAPSVEDLPAAPELEPVVEPATEPVPVVGAQPDADVAPEPPAPASVAPPEATPEPVAVGAAPAPIEPEPDDAGPDEPDDDLAVLGSGPRAPRLTLRAVAFGAALALLMAAVPALGWVGSERLLDSRGGEVVKGGTDASEPGYRALVNPTPTALVVHRDATGYPVSATILSLGAGEAGGTVLLVPLTLQPIEGSYFHTIIAGYDSTRNDDGFRRAIEDVIGISVPPPIIDVTDESLATLVAPVAPLELTVTDPMVTEDGTTVQGPVSLSAEQVGPYLRATREGEPEIAHLERMRDVWVAWLAAIGDATGTEPIGAAATGMGTFLRELAAGDPVVETLDVEEQLDYLQGTSYVPAAGMGEQVIDAVPFPLSPRTGRRFSIELLNGVTGETLPMSLVRQLILAGGALTGVGNAAEFGQDETTILYKGEDWQEEAQALQALLGDGVEIDQMSRRRADAENEDMVITIGSDVLSRYEEEDTGG